MVLVAVNNVAWGLLKGYPWWPLYVIDPHKLRPNLYHLGSAHRDILEKAKKESNKYRIVYYFGSHDFGLHSSTQLKVWGGKDHPVLMAGYPSSSCLEMDIIQLFSHAIREAEDYLITDKKERTLPYMIPSDLDPSIEPPSAVVIDLVDSDEDDDVPFQEPTKEMQTFMPAPPSISRPSQSDRFDIADSHHTPDVPYNSLAWVRPRGYPWWPVYVCDPDLLRPDLHHLGSNHVNILTRAKKEPDEHRLVYYLGRYVFGLLATKLKPWDCVDREIYADGCPNSMFDNRPDLREEFAAAMAEANECFTGKDGNPKLPFLEPWDLNKKLQAPPKPVVPYNSLGWGYKEGYPWLPIFVLDPQTVRPNLRQLGDKHADDLRQATLRPNSYRLVYVFGLHEIVLRPNNMVKPWHGPDHRTFVKGSPKNLKNEILFVTLAKALQEVKDYVNADESTRLLPLLDIGDIGPAAATSNHLYYQCGRMHHDDVKMPLSMMETSLLDSVGCLAWFKPPDQPWWPVYVCDPDALRDNLHILGGGHLVQLLRVKNSPRELRLIYFLGRYIFGLQKAEELKQWNCPEKQDRLRAQPMPGSSKDEIEEFTNAMSEAMEYSRTGVLPYIASHDLDLRAEAPSQPIIPLNSLAWALRDGYPWMPVYVCDPSVLKSNMRNLGNKHASILEIAKQNTSSHRIVYHFGAHDFVLHKTKGKLRMWNGSDHTHLLNRMPRSLFAHQTSRDWRVVNTVMYAKFETAMKEVEAFIKAKPSQRLLPKMVPSDLEISTLPLLLDNDEGESDERMSIDNGMDAMNDNEETREDVNADADFDCIVWAMLQINVWRPAYICNPFKLKTDLTLLGNKHGPMVNEARNEPKLKRIFGLRRFPQMIKPWKCQEHASFEAEMRQATPDATDVLEEIEEFCAAAPSNRILPCFAEEDEYDFSTVYHRLRTEEINEAVETKKSNKDMRSINNSSRTHDYHDGKRKAMKDKDMSTHSGKGKGKSTVPPVGSRATKKEASYSDVTHSSNERKRTSSDMTDSIPKSPQPKRLRKLPRPEQTKEKQNLARAPLTFQSVQSRGQIYIPSKDGQTTRKSHSVVTTAPIVNSDMSTSRNSHQHNSDSLRSPSTQFGRQIPSSPVISKESKPLQPSQLTEKNSIYQVSINEIPYDSVAWARMNSSTPWWPVYICDPNRLKPSLQLLGNRHETALATVKKYPTDLRLVYLFGSCTFDICKQNVVPWNCQEQELFVQGHPSFTMSSNRSYRDLRKAVRDAMNYFGKDAYTRLLPQMVESDIVSRTISQSIPQNSIVWAKSGEALWLPVFLCDPSLLNPSRHDLGRINERAIEIAKENPEHYRIVYYFGSRNFGILKSEGIVKWWNCPEHEQFTQGRPVPNVDDQKKAEHIDKVLAAVRDTKAFIATDRYDFPYPYESSSEDTRLPHWQNKLPQPEIPPKNQPPPAAKSQSEAKTPKPVNVAIPRVMRGRPSKSSPTHVETPFTPTKSSTWTSNACLAWAKISGYPWWPSYVCEPSKLRNDLVLLGNGHQAYLEKAKQNPTVCKVVYYFGSHNFGLHHIDSSKPTGSKMNSLKPWNCPDHKTLIGGFPFTMNATYPEVFEEFKSAIKEVEAFENEDDSMRLLPYMVPTDMDLSLKPPPPTSIPLGDMVWALSSGYPWMPAYVCDPHKLRGQLFHLGSSHKKFLEKARANPDECWIVYYFGAHTFGLHKTRGTIKPWRCEEYDNFVDGYAETLLVDEDAWAEFKSAIQEAKAFASADPSTRILPGMVLSDMDSPLPHPTNCSEPIDLTSSPESTPKKDPLSLEGVDISLDSLVSTSKEGGKAKQAPGKLRIPVRYAFGRRIDSSSSSGGHPSDEDTETDDEAKSSVAKLSNTARPSVLSGQRDTLVPDDFKYNQSQRQILQELKENESGDIDIQEIVPHSSRDRDDSVAVKEEPIVYSSYSGADITETTGVFSEAISTSPARASPENVNIQSLQSETIEIEEDEASVIIMKSAYSQLDKQNGNKSEDAPTSEVKNDGVESTSENSGKDKEDTSKIFDSRTVDEDSSEVIELKSAYLQVNEPSNIKDNEGVMIESSYQLLGKQSPTAQPVPKIFAETHATSILDKPGKDSAVTSVAWVELNSDCWWPVYIDTSSKQEVTDVEVVHFVTQKREILPAKSLKAWNCDDHDAFLAKVAMQGNEDSASLAQAIQEAKDFLESSDATKPFSGES
ncbi:hypothetical protein Ae201684P_018932 [Aphanomyces euteiches]|nr:hypothetical protein Ae201684P_018932 [Aphanomyces euteiches]